MPKKTFPHRTSSISFSAFWEMREGRHERIPHNQFWRDIAPLRGNCGVTPGPPSSVRPPTLTRGIRPKSFEFHTNQTLQPLPLRT